MTKNNKKRATTLSAAAAKKMISSATTAISRGKKPRCLKCGQKGHIRAKCGHSTTEEPHLETSTTENEEEKKDKKEVTHPRIDTHTDAYIIAQRLTCDVKEEKENGSEERIVVVLPVGPEKGDINNIQKNQTKNSPTIWKCIKV
ncbi:---NA--- [Octopus vulgaris]|uniref:---NA n=1 Tax=Octopus vulgaris TaxID=6645 RepID=A0AA36BE12_OCTVU|nr:---NA--- [Octopus vulgaris]